MQREFECLKRDIKEKLRKKSLVGIYTLDSIIFTVSFHKLDVFIKRMKYKAKPPSLTIWLRMLMLFGIVVTITSQTAFAQDENAKTKLQLLRKEKAQVRMRLEKQRQQERNTLDVLEHLDQEMNLLYRLIGQLKSDEKKIRNGIQKNNKTILSLREKFEKEKEIYSKRAIHLYKYKRKIDLESLLKAKSFSQVIVWLKYHQRISEADERRLRNLRETRLEIETTNESRQKNLNDLQKILAEKSGEEDELKKNKTSRQKILDRIRQDSKLFAQKIEEINRATKEIERLVRERETGELRSTIPVPTGPSFSTIKGRMNWPVSGTIIKKFGIIKNPVTGNKTSYYNEGIDVRAEMGDPISVPYDGVVTAVTWVRGIGNVIIVSHAGGYYTAYTHLSEILVSIGEEVVTGDLIGRVGESGSISGPILHFEIWQGTKSVNPESWLRKDVPIVAR